MKKKNSATAVPTASRSKKTLKRKRRRKKKPACRKQKPASPPLLRHRPLPSPLPPQAAVQKNQPSRRKPRPRRRLPRKRRLKSRQRKNPQKSLRKRKLRKRKLRKRRPKNQPRKRQSRKPRRGAAKISKADLKPRPRPAGGGLFLPILWVLATSSPPPLPGTFHTTPAAAPRIRQALTPNRSLESLLPTMWFARSPLSSLQTSSDPARYPHCGARLNAKLVPRP